MSGATSAPIVATSEGRIEGLRADGVFVFKGVPFAAPPVGRRRFRPPVRPERWDGVRPCLRAGPISIQSRTYSRYSPPESPSEDCLYLNLWTPALDDAARPVLVFYHGGGNVHGSGSVPIYDGTRFARDGVVMVTANYRLGALGGLYLDELFAGFSGTGNLGSSTTSGGWGGSGRTSPASAATRTT